MIMFMYIFKVCVVMPIIKILMCVCGYILCLKVTLKFMRLEISHKREKEKKRKENYYSKHSVFFLLIGK